MLVPIGSTQGSSIAKGSSVTQWSSVVGDGVGAGVGVVVGVGVGVGVGRSLYWFKLAFLKNSKAGPARPRMKSSYTDKKKH